MRKTKIVTLGILLAGLTAIAVAQEPRDEPRPEPRPERQAPAAHENQRPEPRDEKHPQKPDRDENAKPGDDKRPSREPSHEQRRPEQEQRGEVRHDEHARPVNRHVRIPEDRYRANFGRQHTFVVNRTVIVEGQPRFQYVGYWFALADPWPAEWSYTDDCYIDFIDGEYFLFNVLHPGVRIAVFVVE